jgi:hypothetical protein
MASFVTNEGANLLTAGTINWASDTIRARLVASSFTPNKDDTTMTSYTLIGTDQTLANKTKTKDTTNDRIVYTNTVNITWTAVAGGSTIGNICLFKFVTNDAGSTPICVIDVTDTPTNGSDIVLTPHADGLFYLQQ